MSEASERLRKYVEADEAQNAELDAKLAEFMASHVSDRGMVHTGRRATCISVDCTPPSLPVREGDIVHIDMPYRDTDGAFRVTSEQHKDGSVTLVFEAIT